MKKTLTLALITLISLQASEITLDSIGIESTLITEVAQNAQTSADVADALSKSIPSIDMSRRSAIANDIFIRGQKRDNISVNVDGTKIYGACPNRMDPPTSHILANQIDTIEVIEGPYDVENYGTMSGGVKIKTKKPTKQLKGEVNIGFGAFGYKKFGATLSGGNDKIRLLITASKESSQQYKDGNGDDLATQTRLKAPMPNRYKVQYEDLQAYEKRSLNAKAFINISNNQELQMSYTANRSTDILYANGPMDATYDDSDIYSIAYNIKNLNPTLTNVNMQYYYSSVEHPMTTKYRNASNMAKMDITNDMRSAMQGVKLKNSLLIAGHEVLLGLDASKREWSGEYLNTSTGVYKADSISDTQTINKALFTKIKNSYDKIDIALGLRYDSTQITNEKYSQNREYSALNANILASYNLNTDNKVFFGVGKASRVPDARELYFLKSNKVVGTPSLNQTTNTELDLGYEGQSDDFSFKIKLFYSMLQDYIYIKKAQTINAFYNIDATVYGSEITASYYINDDITIDSALSYKRGEKNTLIAGQTDKDLADIAPLRGNVSLNYEYRNNSLASIEVQASDKWSKIDNQNGEQELSAWSIVNLKLKHEVNKKFYLTFGVNNLLDETYATSNTYADLTLIVTGTSDAMLLNEPGRYIYTNLDFKF